MTLKSYIWSLRIFTAISIATLVLVILFIDPKSSLLFPKMLFYVSLFFSLSGIFNLVFLRLRRKLIQEEGGGINVGMSFRQAILLAILTIGMLVLQSFRMLVWWDGLMLVAGVFLVELYFLSRF
jgi:hypothetical protein